MALDQKTKAKETPEPVKPLQFRDNAEVKAKIEAYKKEHPDQHVYYTRLVKEAPERAVDTFILRDVQKFEAEMKLIARQMGPAKEWYEKQDAAAKARIDVQLEGISPMYRDKAFVQAVFRESDRQTRKQFTQSGEAPQQSPAPKAGAKVAA